MKMTNSELRKQARTALEGNWGKGVSATLIYLIIVSIVPVPFGFLFDSQMGKNSISFFWTLFSLPLAWGFVVYFLKIVRTESKSVWSIFDGYKQFGRIFITLFLRGIYILLWALLLIVPGIIKTLSYAMTEFILLDNSGISAEEAIHRSRVMMDGNKMKLFVLYLSFIGWSLLCILTLGVGFLILIPYIKTSVAAFYKDLVNEEKGEIDVQVTDNSNLNESSEIL